MLYYGKYTTVALGNNKIFTFFYLGNNNRWEKD